MSLSCIPCATRKVRCDRLSPCTNCTRRKGDICRYPIPKRKASKTDRKKSLTISREQRIEELEKYIRSLGDNPDTIASSISASIPQHETEHDNNEASADIVSTSDQSTPLLNESLPGSDLTTNTKEDMISNSTSKSGDRRKARLIEHEKQTTYIDMPMWYSWKEAKQISDESSDQTKDVQQQQPSTIQVRQASLLDPVIAKGETSLHNKHPQPQTILDMWKKYLTNVHPLVKIFFDWEKEPILQKAAGDPASLSEGEQAFTFAIYFITILSLTEEECILMTGSSNRHGLLDQFQLYTEKALFAAEFIATSDLLVLQAFMLYLLPMRDRARQATWFSLLGIALRIAQRLGLHRDGDFLSLPPLQAEERRRVWWQLQHLEILIAMVVGSTSMTLYGNWDTKMPANLEDGDYHVGMDSLPPNRHGLTSMSHCLWRYHILFLQRKERETEPNEESLGWVVSPHLSMADKEARIGETEKALGEAFLKYCDPLDPLHLHIQIGIHGFILSFRRFIRQPVLANAKITEMPMEDRDFFLKISVKCLEYYVLGQSTPSIAQFKWHNEYYFQWTACKFNHLWFALFTSFANAVNPEQVVYVLIEAHHRASTPEASNLWALINRVCKFHPSLVIATNQQQIADIGRLILLSWHQRRKHLLSVNQQPDTPWCIGELQEKLAYYPQAPDSSSNADLPWAMDSFAALDFDLIDWTAWERAGSFEFMG